MAEGYLASTEKDEPPGENTDIKIVEKIQRLSVEQLENLCEDLLDFDTQDDLVKWLRK